MPEHVSLDEMKVDDANLYREETFTDLRVASIRHLVPVKPDGSPDPSREAIFVGQTHVMTNAGPVPIQCPIEATTLEEAIQKFPEAAREGIQQMVEEVREIQREAASRIVVPKTRPDGTIQLP